MNTEFRHPPVTVDSQLCVSAFLRVCPIIQLSPLLILFGKVRCTIMYFLGKFNVLSCPGECTKPDGSTPNRPRAEGAPGNLAMPLPRASAREATGGAAPARGIRLSRFHSPPHYQPTVRSRHKNPTPAPAGFSPCGRRAGTRPPETAQTAANTERLAKEHVTREGVPSRGLSWRAGAKHRPLRGLFEAKRAPQKRPWLCG